MIELSHWYGRLGNNIQQCAIGTMVARNHRGTFKSKDHEIIFPHQTSFGRSDATQVSKFFYYEGSYKEVDVETSQVYEEMREICKDFVRPHLDLPRISILDPDDTIVIHVRSGDVFDKDVENPIHYVPNPLKYYNDLIDSFDHAIVVTENDNHNPIVDELRKNTKVTVQSLTVQEDFATLLGAKHLASSGVGTFAISAALCSKNIEHFYCSDVHITEHLNWRMLLDTDVKVHLMELPNYLKPGEWTNSEEQRQFILSY